MDTVITMEITGKNTKAALGLVSEEIRRLDQLLSVEGSGSEIALLNSGTGAFLSDETMALLEYALSIAESTGGAYDCTIQPAAAAWGWYSGDPAVPDEAALDSAMELVGYEKVQLSENHVVFSEEGMGIDLGGIGKGYAAGRLNTILRDAGITSGWVSLGGNVLTIGSKPGGEPWVIGIADPDQPAGYLCTVAVSDRSVVTSGDYQRCFTQDGTLWHHILDPDTGYSVKNGLRSVTIVCADDTLADGLSTALFVMGLDKSIDFWRSGIYEFEAVFLTDDQIYVTAGLADGFACQEDYEVVTP